jgi:betaine-aldehyde dehydrogenase
LLGNFYSAGEVCSNGTRVFVHRSVMKRFLAQLLPRVRRMRIGDPLDPATQVGALISEAHMRKVLAYIEQGRAAGARVLVGGHRVRDGALARDGLWRRRFLIGARTG